MSKGKAGIGVCLYFLLSGARVVQAQTEPQPAPANTVLVLGACVVANYKGGPKDVAHAGTTIEPLYCKSFDSSLAAQFLAPGEYRVFVHLIGAQDEYIVSCLGKITYSTWKGHYSVSHHCVIPGRQRNDPFTGSDPFEVEHAWYAAPVVGDYVSNAWDKKAKIFTITFAGRTYREPTHSFKYEILRTTSSSVRMLPPGEIPAPYSCPNGELLVENIRKCRPGQ